ncbi:MAG: ABC transporter ATP-binding protein [Hyphomicrobiales bacterium]|nr:ABC transporter ATP-binding protein [Hyphomicrobiales bacterium]
MRDPAIRVFSVGKVFRVWRHPSDMLKEALSGRRRHSEFEALRDISFDVQHGSVVGIMGRNGAGKSTLLRIIAGTLDATRGRVAVAGRVSAILELGTGFHPEYTGRENVFLGGLCLGLTRAQVAAKLEEIVSFAELEDFIDQPFRTYSSGMQARLTFSVATAVDPDILIIDEALAVGDARFQLKSFDRVRQFREQGRSILLVSHDIHQVVSICDHAILLEKGSIFAQGEPGVVGNIYHELLFGPPKIEAPVYPEAAGGERSIAEPPAGAAGNRRDETAAEEEPAANAQTAPAALQAASASSAEFPLHESGDTDVATGTLEISCADDELSASETINRAHRYGDGAVQIRDFHITDPRGNPVSMLESLGPYEFVFYLEATRNANDLSVGIMVRSPRGIEVFGANTRLLNQLRDMAAGTCLRVRVPFRANLGHGTYFASAAVARKDNLVHDARYDALQFTVDKTAYHDASLTNIDPEFLFEAVKFQKAGDLDRADVV